MQQAMNRFYCLDRICNELSFAVVSRLNLILLLLFLYPLFDVVFMFMRFLFVFFRRSELAIWLGAKPNRSASSRTRFSVFSLIRYCRALPLNTRDTVETEIPNLSAMLFRVAWPFSLMIPTRNLQPLQGWRGEVFVPIIPATETIYLAFTPLETVAFGS